MDLPTTTPFPCHAPYAALPLVVHVTDELDGEPGESLLSLLQQMPAGRYRHMVIGWRDSAMWELHHRGHATQVVSVPPHRHPIATEGVSRLGRLYRRLQRLRPALVHTQSTAVQWLAAMAGVPVRLHGASTCNGAPVRHGMRSWLARLLTPAPPPVRDSAVDCARFHPRLAPAAALGPAGFMCDGAIVLGAAGPMDGTHGHLLLAEAFLHLLPLHGPGAQLRLLLAGDGPERAACNKLLESAGAAHLAWLPGSRDDIARLMRIMDVFVAPQCAPHSESSLLQAMASGLPVVACQGGAHSRIIQTGWSGALVPAGDALLLADTLCDYTRVPGLARRHGQRARQHVLSHHSLSVVAQRYLQLYDRLLQKQGTQGQRMPW